MKTTIYIMILIGVLATIPFTMNGETKVIPLKEDIMKPDQIVVGNKQIYITEGTNIYIFTKNDIKYLTKFGKKGEGPGEIQGSRRGNIRFTLIPLRDKLYLYNRNKVLYFSLDGKFLEEKRISTGFVRNLVPVGDQYVGRSFIRGRNRSVKIAVNIFDSNFANKKLFYGTEEEADRGGRFKHFMPGNIFILRSFNGEVYINDTQDFRIKVLNQSGKEVRQIRYDYKRGAVSGKTRADIFDYYKNHPTFKNFYDRFKNRIEVGKTYNAIRNFSISDGIIYVQTYKKSDQGTEVLLFETGGKFLKKRFVPIKDINIFDYYPYAIHQKKLYQIVENEDEEVWELHMSKI